MTKGILYYSDNALNMRLARAVRNTISQSGLPITSVTLKPTNFGHNIHLPLERSYKTMYKQILTGLEAMPEDIVYFCEHDVLYHPSHFAFTPTEEKFYYNGNYWMVRLSDGFAINYDVSPLSGLVGFRPMLITHFKERLAMIEEKGFGLYMGFEPMTHNRVKWEHMYPFEVFTPQEPNVDLCHQGNLTWKRWNQKQFRKKPKFWNEANYKSIPYWPNLPATIAPFFPIKTETEAVIVPSKEETLSIVIPARNEEFLGITIENILRNIEGNTNIIVALDGYTVPIPEIPQDPRVIILGYHQSVGQRAATNNAVKLSTAKYIMKVDAHCAFDKGFDVKLMNKMQDNYTMVPIMYNLHAFDWVCPDGHRRYQSPSGPCKECGKPTTKDIKWIAKRNPTSVCYRFDPTPHFQYFNEFKKRPEYKQQLLQEGITDTMSLQGSCFMLTRDKYWELNICDESFGSWGSQGIEVACKTWFSGGRVVCNHSTWYAHMFRTQGGDFGFPYQQDQRKVEAAKKRAKELFINGKFGNSVRNLDWLLAKFAPVPDWTTATQ